MRKVGINIDQNVIYGVDSFFNCIAATGFEAVFTCGLDEDFIRHISKLCQEKGLTYDYLHAPWDKINDLWLDTPDSGIAIANFNRSVDLAAEYGIPIIITHLSSKEDAPTVTDIGRKRFDEFVNYAAKKNIKIAVENQRLLGNIATILEMYGPETNVGFCWDVGHEKCFAHGREYLPLFPNRCIATHIHDNNCVYNGDDHILPYDGCIDFRHTADLIHRYDIQSTLMLEIDLPHEGSDKYRNLSVEQFAAKAYAAINRIRIISEY